VLADRHQEAERTFSIPMIDDWGKFTGTTAHRTIMKPSSYIATVVATINNRALKWVGRHQAIRNARKLRGVISSASYIYAITKNLWFWDRFLYLSKNLARNAQVLRGIIKKYLGRLDDYTRFVHSQVTIQTNWLLFRASRPRDKSSSRGFLTSLWKRSIALFKTRPSYVINSCNHVASYMEAMNKSPFHVFHDPRSQPGLMVTILKRQSQRT
jgi:predicted DNA-binding protein